MSSLQKFFEGYKTYLFLAGFVVASIFLGTDPLTGDLTVNGQLDPGKIQTAFLAAAGMSVKAAFDRFTKK